jgi:spermidine/putrescine transport system substrate-binding protein
MTMRRNFRFAAAMATMAVVAAAAVPAQAEGELFLYNWSNYYPPDLMKKFEEETGIKVTLDNFASESDMLAKLQAGGGGYDVVFPTHRRVKIMIEQGLAAKLDAPSLSNWKNVAEPFRSTSVDPKREYSAPYMWGTTGFTYDSARVPGGKLEESWKEYFEPREELKGQMASLNDMADVYNAAAYYLGIDKCTDDAGEAQKILDLLTKQKPYLKTYSNDGTIDRMIAGEVIMHMQWNGAAHRVRKEKPTAVFVYPKEGTTFWSDNMVIPANAPNMENAKTFINWMLDPKNAAAASNYTGYMNAIDGSGEFMDPGLNADPAVNMPAEYGSRLSGFKECSQKAYDLRERVWTKLKS